MENYKINTNDLVVNDQSVQYNFLCEMYPVIDTLYNQLWFYENIASMNEEIKMMKINQLKQYINEMLKIYHIPESIIFIKNNTDYIEPISDTSFKIGKNVKKQSVVDDMKDTYIENNKANSFFKYDMPRFKELTKTKHKKR